MGFLWKGVPVKITTYERKDAVNIANTKNEIKVSEYENKNALKADISSINISKVAVKLQMKVLTHRLQEQLKKLSVN